MLRWAREAPLGSTVLSLHETSDETEIDVRSLPLDPTSAQYVETIGADTSLHPDFGSGEWPPGSGSPIGIPYRVLAPGQTPVDVSFSYADESDPGPYPIPTDAPIEGGIDGTGDRHVLLIDPGQCLLYELFNAFPQPDGSWQAGSGAIFDLNSHQLRPDTYTSADAAGLPIFPGLVRYEEVADGEINHALRFTAPQTQRAYVWPARHHASSLTDKRYPPMGQGFRLRNDFLPHPRLRAAGITPSSVEFARSSLLLGATYNLERSSDLTTATWESIDEFVPTESPTTRATQRVPVAATMWYRLRL